MTDGQAIALIARAFPGTQVVTECLHCGRGIREPMKYRVCVEYHRTEEEG